MENNIEKFFPFDSKLVNGKYDRGYVAEDFARYFKAFISSGLFMEENTSLQVLANDDMTVTLRPGKMIIDGYRYDAEKDIIIPLSPADGLLNRIDRISITWSQEDRNIHYTLQEGEFAYEPVAPECRRTAEYKDYVVADIYIAANSISIAQTAITDQRLNSEVCGLAAPFMTFDTTLIFNQLQAFYQETVENTFIWTYEEQNKFSEWLDLIQKQFSDNPAGHLQCEIDNIKKQLGSTDDAFSEEVTYVAGDYCIYNNTMYKFTADKDAGPWDQEVVQKTSVLTELKKLFDSLGGMKLRELSEQEYEELPDKEAHTLYIRPEKKKEE